MLLFIECVIACGLFTLIMLPSVYKNPIAHIMSYPKPIRQRVESLPRYAGSIKKVATKHIIRKVITAIICVCLLACIAYFSGAKTFESAFWHVFILFNAVNWFDVIVLDIIIFCNSKKTMIPGTEDMTEEYKSSWHHIRGGYIGTVLGIIVSLLSAGLVHLL